MHTELQAIDFVSMQHDDELWEELIKQCIDKPEMVNSITIMQEYRFKFRSSLCTQVNACFVVGRCVVGAYSWQI